MKSPGAASVVPSPRSPLDRLHTVSRPDPSSCPSPVSVLTRPVDVELLSICRYEKLLWTHPHQIISLRKYFELYLESVKVWGLHSWVLHRLIFISHVYCRSRFDILGTMKRKLRTDIHYPLTNLDLTPYICPVFRKHPKYNLCAVVVSKIQLFKQHKFEENCRISCLNACAFCLSLTSPICCFLKQSIEPGNSLLWPWAVEQWKNKMPWSLPPHFPPLSGCFRSRDVCRLCSGGSRSWFL